MLDIKQLRERKAELVARARLNMEAAKKENRSLNDQEKQIDDEIHRELSAVSDDLRRAERLQDEERGIIAQAEATLQRATPQASAPPVAGFRNTGSTEFRSVGEFLQAVACASSDLIRVPMGNYGDMLVHKLQQYQLQAQREFGGQLSPYQAAISGMGVSDAASGGILVRKDWTQEFLGKARESAVLLPRCRRIGIGGDFDGLEYPYIDESSRADGSRWGGVRVFWKAEGGTVAASQPKLAQGQIRLEEIMGLAYATERLLRDASALEGILQDAFRSEFSFKVDDGIIYGTGVGQMLGILNSPVTISVAKEAAQAAATVNLQNLLNMYVRMPARLLPGAVWLINTGVWVQLYNLKDTNDNPVYMPNNNVAGAPFGTLLGRPIIPIEQAAALGTQGDIMFVNLGEYVYIEKEGEGLRFDTSMHVRFIYDEMAFRWVYRINGQPIGRAPVTQYKGTTTSSPFIVLDTRA